MPIDILMPALSPTMTEGKLAKWLKNPGDEVKAGQVIAEIETDKATMEVEAVDEGTLAEILVPAGSDGVKVNTVIAKLTAEDEPAAKPAKAEAPKEQPKPEAAKSEPKPEPKPEAKPAEAAKPAPVAAKAGDRIIASPLAKRIAAIAGIDLSGVSGSGPHGRIVKADVDKLKSGAAAPKPAAAPSAAPAGAVPVASGPDARQLADMLGQRYTLKPNSGVRKTIARRLSEAKATIPHFYLSLDVALDKLMALRAEINARGGAKISVNDFVIKAAAIALRQKPDVNAAWASDAIVQYEAVDVSVAVATPNGLITPIIKDADKKTLSAINAEMKDLAARARDGKLKPEEYQGGGFTISNLGMYGIRDFAAIINPPQSAILAVGAGEQRPVVKDGALAIATMMSCTLAVDHRVVDGALGAEFFVALKTLLEDPLGMLI